MQTEQLRQAVEQMKQGEEKGFNYIYGETYNFVYSRAKLAISDEQEVQDLIQEVYVAVYRNIQSLKNVESLYAWLATIIMRQGAKMANRKRNQVLLSEENDGMFEELPDESVKLESDAIRKEDAIIIQGLLEKLPAEQKNVIVSFYYDSLKVEQIADATMTSAGTIKSRLHLARKRLQEYIGELERKEGVRLRGVSAPALILAVKILLEEDTLSRVSAQEIYNHVCAQIGIKASTLVFQSVESGITTIAGTDTAKGLRKGTRNGLTEQMKGQGTGMNKLVSKLATLGKVKLAAITTGIVVAAGIGTATGVYVHQQSVVKEAQAKEKQQSEKQEIAEKKAKETLFADITKRYEKAEELRDNLILEDAVIEILNRDFTTIKTALDEKTADEETEKTMATLEKNLEGYRQQNEQYLAEQRMAIMDYHSEMFPQENQDAWDKLLSEYQELFDAVKYKDANAKLIEVSSAIVAFISENTTEVADNGTDNVTAGNNDNNSGNGIGSGQSGNRNGSTETGNGVGNGGSNTESRNGENGSAENSASEQTPKGEPEKIGDYPNGWTYAEADIMSNIYVKWSDYVYTDEEARAQLAAQLPSRACTLVYYPPEQIEEGKALWNSLDRNIYCVTGCSYSDVAGLYFIYGK